MLKPDTNLFFYSFELYMGVDRTKKTPNNSEEAGIDMDEAYKKSHSKLDNTIKEALYDLKFETRSDKTPATQEYESLMENYRTKASQIIGMKDEQKAKDKLRLMNEKALTKINQIKEKYLEAERIREHCKKTLKDQYKTEFNLAKGLLRMEAAGSSEEIDAERYDYIVEAYLNRWYESYNKMFDNPKLSPGQIKDINSHIGTYQRTTVPIVGFKAGIIKKDLDSAYGKMKKAVKLWAKEGEDTNKVYSDKHWTWGRYPRKKINGENYRMPPLPDGTEFKDEKYPKTTDFSFRMSLHGKRTAEYMSENMPKVEDAHIETGRLVINGENFNQRTENINLQMKSDLISGLESGKSDISKYSFALNTMKANIKTKILTSVDKAGVPTAEVRKLLDKDENLNKLLGLQRKPVVRVKGRASLDGKFGYNKQLAMKRAKNAIQSLKDKYGDSYKFEPVAEVVGPNGEKVDTANEGYKQFRNEWNEKFEDKEINTIVKMKDLINAYARGKAKKLTDPQENWLKERIKMVRGVEVDVATKDTPKNIEIQYNNQKQEQPTDLITS